MKKNGISTTLICAATAGELAACPSSFAPEAERFVSGVGIPATFVSFWHTLDALPDDLRPQWIYNIGIAGAYPDSNIAIGDIVLAESDVYADVGMELPTPEGSVSDFQPMAEMTYGRAFYTAPLIAQIPESLAGTIGATQGYRVHRGRGATVNTCTGTETVGRRRARTTGAVFETMEGAAVIQIGQAVGSRVCQIRAISNFASTRDMRPENIRQALDNLTDFLSRIVP